MKLALMLAICCSRKCPRLAASTIAFSASFSASTLKHQELKVNQKFAVILRTCSACSGGCSRLKRGFHVWLEPQEDRPSHRPDGGEHPILQLLCPAPGWWGRCRWSWWQGRRRSPSSDCWRRPTQNCEPVWDKIKCNFKHKDISSEKKRFTLSHLSKWWLCRRTGNYCKNHRFTIFERKATPEFM